MFGCVLVRLACLVGCLRVCMFVCLTGCSCVYLFVLFGLF